MRPAVKRSQAQPALTFDDVRTRFRPFHQNSLNVAMHLLTTPLGILAVLCLTNFATGGPLTTAALTTVYCLSLCTQLSLGLWAANSAVSALLVALSAFGPFAALGPWSLVGLIVVSYVGQDAAHWITGEVLPHLPQPTT